MSTPTRVRWSTVLSAAVTAGLTLFHLNLLRVRITEGALFQAGVAGRWLVGFLLLAGLWHLRQGLWGRRALVLWALAAVLHAGPAAEPATIARTLPDSILAAVALALLAVGRTRGGRSPVLARPPATFVRANAPRSPHRSLILPSWSPRPPPLAVA